MRRFVPTAVLLIPLICVGAGRAAEVGPDGAQALRNQLQDWIRGFMPPGAKPPELAFTVTPEDGHYLLSVPLPGVRAGTDQASLTATVSPLPDNRWSVDNLVLPPRTTFRVGTGNAAVQATLGLGAEHGNALIDPTLASKSSFDLQADNIDFASQGAGQHQQQHIDRYRASGSLSAGTANTLDLAEQTTAEGWRAAAQKEAGPAVAFGADRAKVELTISGIDRDRAGPAIAAVTALAAAWPPMAPSGRPPTVDQLPPATRAALRTLVEGLRGLAATAHAQETIEGLKVEIAGLGAASASVVRIGFGGEAPTALLRVWFDIGVDGLALHGVPPDAAKLVPRQITFRPSIAGVPTDALTKLAVAATRPGTEPNRLDPEIAALFAQGSVTLGLEALAFTIGPAQFQGAGSLQMISETEMEGQARLTATGFDALMDVVRGNPDMQQALPVLVLARGLARTDGDRLVWDLASTRTGGITLNGVDVSALMGAANHGHKQPR